MNSACSEETISSKSLNRSQSLSRVWFARSSNRDSRSLGDWDATSHSTCDPEHQDDEVWKYFEQKKIKPLFNFLMQHLVIHEPENPTSYLKDLVDKLLLWRAGVISTAPHVFERRHVQAIYRAMDPAGFGAITLEQYHNGFKTLMLNNYSTYPRLDANNMVEKDTFIDNALTALDNNLMSLIKPPYDTICELTVLPDESYDFLLEGASQHTLERQKQSFCLNAAEDKVSTSEDSCGSSCVILARKQAEFASDESSDEVIAPDAKFPDFLIKTALSTSGKETDKISKITLYKGRIGESVRLIIPGLEFIRSENPTEVPSDSNTQESGKNINDLEDLHSFPEGLVTENNLAEQPETE